MGTLELIQQKSFLGREFLIWLWYRAETDPVLNLPGKRRCEIEIQSPLQLDAEHGDAKSSVLRGDSPATSAEAATALREGKKPSRVKLKFSCDGADWITGLDGETLGIGGLQMPKSGRLPFDEILPLRARFVLEFETLLSELFEAFLALRLNEANWKGDSEKIQKWIGEK